MFHHSLAINHRVGHCAQIALNGKMVPLIITQLLPNQNWNGMKVSRRSLRFLFQLHACFQYSFSLSDNHTVNVSCWPQQLLPFSAIISVQRVQAWVELSLTPKTPLVLTDQNRILQDVTIFGLINECQRLSSILWDGQGVY